MNFRTADDMCSELSVKLKKRVGFGMLAKLNLLGMHVEGKVSDRQMGMRSFFNNIVNLFLYKSLFV